MKMRITLLATVQHIQLPEKSRYEEGSAALCGRRAHRGIYSRQAGR
jgi:hypothetical protein